MSILCVTVLAVLIADQAIKLMVRRLAAGDGVALGSWGSLRVAAGRLWLRRLGGQFSDLAIWSIWVAATVSLVIAGTLAPLDPVSVGLLVGGSLSQAVESSARRSVTDYICLPNRMTFNLADLAIAAGAVGIVGELLILMHQKLT
jgi:lipoprotein signal peptidase